MVLKTSYLVKPKMKLLDWIPTDKLNGYNLYENPNAVHFLEEKSWSLKLNYISGNPNAIHLLEKKIYYEGYDSYCDPGYQIDWEGLSRNPGATHLFEEQGSMEKVCVLATSWFKKYLEPAEILK